MRMIKVFCSVTLLLGGALAATADNHVAQEKPAFFVSQSQKLTAAVEAIDHETREVTLRRPDGSTVTFTASEEARNLKQVSAGDIVNAEYVETMSVEVIANEGTEPDAAEMVARARTKEGEMPGIAAMDKRVVKAIVEEINLEDNTFKLRGPNGDVSEFVARNPDNLRRADVGDLVIMTFTEAVAISVEVGQSE